MSELDLIRNQFGVYFLAQNKRCDYVPFQQEAICPTLEALERHEIDKVCFFMPPRTGKSTTVTMNFPAWYLGRHPEHQVIVVSYASDLAMNFGRTTRNLIDSPIHAAAFPKCHIPMDSRAKDDFALSEGGHYYSMGLDGTITGRGAHLFIIDDPIKNTQDALSKANEDFRRETFLSAINTRLEPGGLLVLVMTRWPGDAFSGWLLELFGQEPVTAANLKTWRRLSV